MSYWLMKSEPSVFGIGRLAGLPGKRTSWDGVRNYKKHWDAVLKLE